MQAPEIPPDEAKRLETLHNLNILDTPAEERFDRFTRLAKMIFKVPIALVSLVDVNRQWFKSCIGLNVSETARDISFCGHAILGDEVFIIPDATKDQRFDDNPLVLNEPYIRFYAGYPLHYLDGSKLGTLCIIDSRPRTLDKVELAALKDLAQLAEHEFQAIALATVDELTGISNRRAFGMLAQKSLNVCARQKIPATLVFLDLNGFKLINDRYGHAEGDKVLIAFAEQMKAIFRDSDIFARLGGDEFVVLLTGTSFIQASELIDRLGSSLGDYCTSDGSRYVITFSAGIVEIDPGKEYSLDDLLKQADKLMYLNKQQNS